MTHTLAKIERKQWLKIKKQWRKIRKKKYYDYSIVQTKVVFET